MKKYILIMFVLHLNFITSAYANLSLTSKIDTIINVSDHKLNIVCKGSGYPTVILEAGSGSDLLIWSKVQTQAAKFTRVCSYSRAGIGKSSIPKNQIQFDARSTTNDLHILLNDPLIKSSNPPPYILVGHSYGGLYIRDYLEKYPNEVAGMVLIDATSGSMKMKDYGVSDQLFDALMVVEEKKQLYLKSHPQIEEHKLLSIKIIDQKTIDEIKAQQVSNAILKKINILRNIEKEDMDNLIEMNKRNPHPLGNKPLVVIVANKDEMRDFMNRYRSKKSLVYFIIDNVQRQSFEEMLDFNLEPSIKRSRADKINMLLLSNNSLLLQVNGGHNIPVEQPDVIVTAIKKMCAVFRRSGK